MSDKSPSTKQVWSTDSYDNRLVLEFTAGRDVNSIQSSDEQLVYFDILTNLAHCKMLMSTKIITADEHSQLKQGLKKLLKLHIEGKYLLKKELEDVHMNIEHFLANELNIKCAGKLHTARSRNDQVSTDIRLYIRHQLSTIIKHSTNLLKELMNKALKEKDTIVPGFSHYQPAMYTTMGHVLMGWTQAELRSLRRMFNSLKLYNRCPLGAMAGFGTSWPIDRELCARLLGFEQIEENTLDAISSRGEMECQVASDIAIGANNWGRIAQDLILFSHPYYKFITIDKKYTTGSSVMPQKQNPDVAEVIRGKTGYINGQLSALLSCLSGLPSGYNRDQQLTKHIIIDIFREADIIPQLLREMVTTMKTNKEESLKKCNLGLMNAVDIADWLAINCSLDFRSAYKIIRLASLLDENDKENKKINIDSLKKVLQDHDINPPPELEKKLSQSPEKSISSRKHRGSPSEDMIKENVNNVKEQLNTFQKEFLVFLENYQTPLTNLIS